MEFWIYDSDGEIYIFTTREKALKAFKEWYVEKTLCFECEKKAAIEQMESEGYYYDERIYSAEVID